MQPGHELSHQAVARFLPATGYDLQVNRETRDGASHPDRDAQFESIAGRVRWFQRRGQPVVSVDTKKKESVGDRKDAGRGWQPEGSPDEVRCEDFKEKAPGKVARYGVYDQTADEGRVRAGIDQETAEFGTETLRRWWSPVGIRVDPRATDLSVTSDAGVGMATIRDKMGHWHREPLTSTRLQGRFPRPVATRACSPGPGCPGRDPACTCRIG
jgi:Rhodopirellula transposase DDE domain